MLIFATLGINILAVVVWSIRNNANGFVEVGKLLRGQPSFIPVPKAPIEAGIVKEYDEGVDKLQEAFDRIVPGGKE
jgi:hypothetical protein